MILIAAALSIIRAAEKNPNLVTNLSNLATALSAKLHGFQQATDPELITYAKNIYDEIFETLVEMTIARC